MGKKTFILFMVCLSAVLLSVTGFLCKHAQADDPEPVMIKDINTGGGSDPANLINVSGTLYFTADDGAHGVELWKSDGTSSGTTLIKDINTGVGDSSPANLIHVNSTLFFSANDGSNGIEFWRSDGTAADTLMIMDINTAGSSSPAGFTYLDGILYFSANDGIQGRELWRSNGTEFGTFIVKDINPSGIAILSGSLISTVFCFLQPMTVLMELNYGNITPIRQRNTSAGAALSRLQLMACSGRPKRICCGISVAALA